MKPRIPCPKCNALWVDLYRDNTSGRWRGYPHDAVLHCRSCAFRLFGEAAVRYTDKHMEAYVKKQAEEQAKQAVAEARKARKRESGRLYRQRKRTGQKPVLKVFSSTCSHPPCNDEPRPNSKYCSRICSNRNSRDRAKQRKAS